MPGLLRLPVLTVARLAKDLSRRRRRPALARRCVRRGALDEVAAFARAAAGEPWLVPRAGANVVSGERDRWRFVGDGSVAALLDDPAARGQARLDVPSAFLGAVGRALRVAVDGAESAIFATSGGGLRTPLHSDPSDSVLLHVSGEKRVVLIPPDQSDGDADLLAALLQLRDTPGRQDDLLLAPPLGEAAAAVDRIVVDLAPGDALFVPKRWLHDVESATSTLSVAARLRPGRRASPRRAPAF